MTIFSSSVSPSLFRWYWFSLNGWTRIVCWIILEDFLKLIHTYDKKKGAGAVKLECNGVLRTIVNSGGPGRVGITASTMGRDAPSGAH
jgi:hypothetical protein